MVTESHFSKHKLNARRVVLAFLTFWLSTASVNAAVLVFQSDFGLRDGAVSAMKGVAVSVSPSLSIYDITHEIPPYNIWEAALRLEQAASYWPAGTVFVSVVDPGVGSQRRSVVLKTRSGHYFVTPDNGSLTFIAESLGVEQVREIDEAINRLENSGKSYTFHGRDVYAYTGARLAAGIIRFEEVGRDLGMEYQALPYQKPVLHQARLLGSIPILDIQYGNVWTNIGFDLFQQLEVQAGDALLVRIREGDVVRLEQVLPYQDTFAGVAPGQALLYLNSLGNLALAINQGDFAGQYGIGSGQAWSIEIQIPDVE